MDLFTVYVQLLFKILTCPNKYMLCTHTHCVFTDLWLYDSMHFSQMMQEPHPLPHYQQPPSCSGWMVSKVLTTYIILYSNKAISNIRLGSCSLPFFFSFLLSFFFQFFTHVLFLSMFPFLCFSFLFFSALIHITFPFLLSLSCGKNSIALIKTF